MAEAGLRLEVSESIVAAAASRDEPARLRSIFAAHYDFIWCQLRRLGAPADSVDDLAQRVFMVASRRLAEIELGSERAFLFGAAMRIAADARRTRARAGQREVSDDGALDAAADPSPGPEKALEQKDARALLDEVLDAMPFDLRTVFVLFEIEELSTEEIAGLLGLPAGTVASRLRRARESFLGASRRMRAKGAHR